MAKTATIKTEGSGLLLPEPRLRKAMGLGMSPLSLSCSLGADAVTPPVGVVRTMPPQAASGCSEVIINFWLKADKMTLRHEGRTLYSNCCDSSIGEALREAFSKMGFTVIRRIYE